MYRVLFGLFCSFNFLLLNRAEEFDIAKFEDNQAYNILSLHQRLHSAANLRNKSPFLTNKLLFDRVERNYVLEPLENVFQNSSKCEADILYTLWSLGNFSNLWALNFLDSFGRPESGILQGNFKWVGDYNECIKVYAPPNTESNFTSGNFNGQYCTITYTLELHNQSTPLTFGICLPDSCSQNDLQGEIMNLLFKAGGFPVLDEASVSSMPIVVTCMPRERHLNVAAKSFIALLSIFCALALVGSTITVVKYCKNLLQEQKGSSLIVNISDQELIAEQDSTLKKKVESENVTLLQCDGSNSKGFLDSCESFLSCFCLFTNGAKLLNTDSSGQFLCIHGIRFLSMSWVILGHTYSVSSQVSRNIMEVLDVVIDDIPFQIVPQGVFSVDSFFVLSGFLLSYLSMKEFSRKKGSINWVYFYIHRYVRLTPIYMVVLGFSASLYYYLGSGPFWPLGDYDPNCRKTWWWNLLYINNFTEITEQCMVWSWYLANDMQFFVISPIFLISLWRWPKVGYSLLGLFVVASMLSNFFITYEFDLMSGMVGFITSKNIDMNQAMLKYADYFQKLYIKPYTRIGPYLVGIILGHILFMHKTSNRPKLNWIYLCIGWIVASAVTLTCVYGLYHNHPSLLARSTYNATSRICFGIGLSWVIYVCLTNQGGIINSILSYKLFIPLSRLTYSAYLIHLLIVMGYYNSLKRRFEFSHPSVVVLYLGFMIITYALSLPVSLILESPIVSLEKLIRNKFTNV